MYYFDTNTRTHRLPKAVFDLKSQSVQEYIFVDREGGFTMGEYGFGLFLEFVSTLETLYPEVKLSNI